MCIYIYIIFCDVLLGSSPGRFLMRLPTTSLGILHLMFSACTGLSGATDRSGSQGPSGQEGIFLELKYA